MNEIVGSVSENQTVVGKIGTVYGKDGESAYEIALKSGFDGTEEEWLASLKGNPGYTPVRGVDYWTKDDIDEMKSYVDSLAAGTILPATVEG